MTVFIDVETGELTTDQTLADEFHYLSEMDNTDAETVEQFISNCMVSNGGTLETAVAVTQGNFNLMIKYLKAYLLTNKEELSAEAIDELNQLISLK